MKKIVSPLLLTAFLTLQLPASAATNVTNLDRIIAVVNTDVITDSQLNNEIAQAQKQMQHNNTPMPPESELRKKILDHLVDKSLQMQLVKQKNIKVADEEVNKAIENIAKQNHLTLEQLKPALESSGLNYSEFRHRIQEQILLQRLQQQEVVAKTVTVNDEEVNEFLRKNQGKMQNYSAFHVVDLIAANETQAQQVAKSLQKSTDTEQITKETGAQNNDLGWRTLPEFPAIFSSQVVGMHVGDVSKPIKAPNGYHVLKLVDAKGDKIKLTKKDAQNLVFQTKANDAVKKWLAEIRKNSYVQIMR